MFIAIDGAVKAPGTDKCLSVGCALFPEETGSDFYRVICEPTQSTSQRGETNGLLLALQYAVDKATYGDDVLILTDSEYLFKTIEQDWCRKWRDADWISGTGEPPKNQDLWAKIVVLLDILDAKGIEYSMLWTKGHIFNYPNSKINQAMKSDATGAQLYSNISTMLNVANCLDRAVERFNEARLKHDFPKLPVTLAQEYIIANATVDAIAVYCANILKAHRDALASDDINN